jgi:hypothetical protein
MPAEPDRQSPEASRVPVARIERAATEQGSGQLVRGVRDFVDAHVVGEPARRRITGSLEHLVALAASHVGQADAARLVVVMDVTSRDVQLVLWAVPAGHPPGGGDQPRGGCEFWASFSRG